ncbi:SymE family type I addiction module toxin [Collimonas arenae]|uniref:SymE family type I addiction module toxin n=1 Tax=Collimonas arenae TaxID=279058 RepID=UPI000570297F|nr:SymE family type I addiction module toxin [Collimonas arenae]
MTSTRTPQKNISRLHHHFNDASPQPPDLAKQNPTQTIPDPATVDEARRLTASFYQEEDPEILWIRLNGKGIERAGFSPYSPVAVRIMHGCIVITSN